MKQTGLTRTMLLLALIVPSMMMAQVTSDEPIAPQEVSEPSRPEQDAVLTIVEQMPEFPGGTQAMMAYLTKQLQYPEEAKEEGIQGKVFLSLVVNQDGSISDVRVLRGAHPLLDREAIRVVKSMPKWNPGMQNGRACRVQYNLPVAFKLSE